MLSEFALPVIGFFVGVYVGSEHRRTVDALETTNDIIEQMLECGIGKEEDETEEEKKCKE